MTRLARLTRNERAAAVLTKEYRRAQFSDQEILAIRHAYRRGGSLTDMMNAVGWKGARQVFRDRCAKVRIPMPKWVYGNEPPWIPTEIKHHKR